MRNLAPPLLLAMASAVHAFIDPTVSALESNLGECAISCVTGTNLEQTGINCFGATRTDPAVVSTFEECVSSNCNRSIKLCQASDAPSLKAAPVATNTSVVTGGVPTLNGQPYPTMNGVPCVFSLNCSQFTLGVWFWNGENTDASWNKAMMRKYPSFQTDYSGPFTDDNYLTLRDPADTAAGIKTPLPLRNVSAWDDATDASAFLTFYADQTTDAGTGLGLVTDDWLHYFGQFLKKTGTDSGRRIFLRWCPEMEGVWMTYGKDPNYASVWRRMYTILKQEFPDVIIVWAPNYNWPNDVGGDMELFPGPEYVDVIGSSLYWKGFGQNGPIEPTFMTSIMNGQYALATQYNKPFVITETSAAWEHDVPSSTDEVTIKKQWWGQLLSTDFLDAFPNIQAAYIFDMNKQEEFFRDFKVSSPPEVQSAFLDIVNSLDSKGRMYWAQDKKAVISSSSMSTATATATSATGSLMSASISVSIDTLSTKTSGVVASSISVTLGAFVVLLTLGS